MNIELLLAHADDHRPVLEEGLPVEATWQAPRPRHGSRADVPTWAAVEADPNDLKQQRWGVIAPSGEEGDRLLEAIAPLVRLREEEQGAPARVYRVDAAMDEAASRRWTQRVYHTEQEPEQERPRYLLILGDLDQVSSELQQSLVHAAFVGRLHAGAASGAAGADGYAAYAAKVVARSGGPAEYEAPDALFHAARDGTRATEIGYEALVRPCLESAEAWRKRGALAAARVVELRGAAGGPEALLDAAAGPRPSVLLSVSHGLGAPHGGWPSPEQQRAKQGALMLEDGRLLDAETMARARFLPGGMWFCVACFGAGTPHASAFYPWLSVLAQAGVRTGRPEAVLEGLPRGGDRAFIAAMPQAALANPEGPLAIIGHLDLAWTHSFQDPGFGSRASRMLSAVKALVQGGRAGVALEALMRFYREANDELMASYQAEEDARAWAKPDPTDRRARGDRWMLRNDLRGYVLLGDPAARLPLRGS